MEQFQHSHHQPRKKNSARVNVTISLVIHGLIFAAGAYWAAHEGVLGKKLQALSVLVVPKEKKADEAKKPEAKTETVKKADEVKPADPAKNIPPPKVFVPPPAAVVGAAAPPPAVSIGDFVIDPDAITTTDPIGFYKQQVESVLRSRWERPPGVKDNDFTAEVEMRVDAKGNISGYEWKKDSGD